MKVIAYTRVSTKEQGNRLAEDRLGLTAQMDSIKRFCQFEGHEIIAHYEEVVSAKYGFDERLQLRLAFARAKKEGACVLVSKLDRLSRSVEFVGHLVNNGYKFGTVEDGFKYDPTMLYMRAAFAEDERLKVSRRTKDALAVRKAQGMKLGGARVANDGRSHLELSRAGGAALAAEADAFAKRIGPVILRMRRDGMTSGAIAQELNEQGNKTFRGGKWYATTVCNVLRRLDDEKALTALPGRASIKPSTPVLEAA